MQQTIVRQIHFLSFLLPNLFKRSLPKSHQQQPNAYPGQTDLLPYHAKQLITLWAALHGKPQIWSDKRAHIYIEDPSWSSVTMRKLFSPLICGAGSSHPLAVPQHGEPLQCILGLLPAKASPWPACSYGKWHARGEASVMQAWRKVGSCHLGLQSGESKPRGTSPGLCSSVSRWELEFIHLRDSLALPECGFLQVSQLISPGSFHSYEARDPGWTKILC